MICPKCGAALDNQAVFCNVCGAPQESQAQPVYQQPTYAQQVYRERQEALQQAAQPPKPKKKRTLLLLVIAAAVILCAAAVILGLVFSRKTVYLPEEQITENRTSVTTHSYEYTKDGKLSFYRVETKHKEDYPFLEDSTISASYTYSKDGLPEYVEFEVNGRPFEYEYIYTKDGLLKGLEGDHQEFKVKCDEEGRITSVKSAENDFYSAKYAYHDNGILRKVTIIDGSSELEYRYNEQGKLERSSTSFGGKTTSVNKYTYDEKGRTVKTEIESYSGGERSHTTIVTQGYEKDNFIVSYSIAVEMEDGSVELLFETEDRGLERTFDLVDTDFSGVAEAIEEELKEVEDQFCIEVLYDEHGNLLEMNVDVSELGFLTSSSNSYAARKVPKHYAFLQQDPIYFLSIDPDTGAPAQAPAPAADAPATEAPTTPEDMPATEP